MSANDIEVGDLVYVRRGCGCFEGHIFKVQSFVNYNGRQLICSYTARHPVEYRGTFAWCGENGFPLPWLRKIPPLSELERTSTKEELHA